MFGYLLIPLPWEPSVPTDRRKVFGVQLVVPLHESRMKTDCGADVPPGTRFEAKESNATKRPSMLIAGSPDPPLACAPSKPTETRVVAFGQALPERPERQLVETKTSSTPFVLPRTRLLANDPYATTVPSGLIAGGAVLSARSLA